MNRNLEISNYLTQIHRDWESSRSQFPLNTYPVSQWLIPFFGNPATARIATVGANPSSTEFDHGRDWGNVKSRTEWKKRLRDYFKHKTPAHEWFEPWRIGLEMLGASYPLRLARCPLPIESCDGQIGKSQAPIPSAVAMNAAACRLLRRNRTCSRGGLDALVIR
jgi:hypothetical protein